MNFDVNDFRRRYPELKPYEGENYKVAQQHNCLLLVIGESHYLPEDSTIHKDCDMWYASDDTKLNDDEKGFINTSTLINTDCDKKSFQAEHGIYKYGYQAINQNQYGPNFDDFTTLFKYTVFYNFYLRPANKGNTFRELLTEKDNIIANINFKYMLEQYRPNGIIFLSCFAFDCCWERQVS